MWLRARDLGLSGVALFATVFFASPPLRALTITVNSTADTVADDGFCTLREAIVAANTDTASGASSGECVAGAGADTLDLTGVSGTITLTSALPSLSTDMSISGPGAASLTISGNNLYRVFFVTNGATVSISDLTIAQAFSVGGEGGYGALLGGGGGGAAGMGAAVFVNTGARANVTSVHFLNNVATGGEGGGTGGSNHAGGGGGGFDDHDGMTAANDTGGNGGNGGDLGGTGGAGSATLNGGNATGDGAGGGGGGGTESANGGIGGFAGGGGGQSVAGTGGGGGFGAGGGGYNGPGGAFGGQGASPVVACGVAGTGGGGGAGLGGAIFVRDGGTLNVSSCDFESNNTYRGSGGIGDCSNGKDGKGKGGAIFVMAGATAQAACPSDLTFSGNSAADQASVPGFTNADDNDLYGSITFSSDVTVVLVSPASTDYSDPVDLSATVTDLTNLSTVINSGTVTFLVDGVYVGSASVVNGTATLAVASQTLSSTTGVYPDLAANTYTITATYSPVIVSGICGSTNTNTLTVALEAAVVVPSASNPTAVKVNSPGGTAGPITLCADITDPGDDTTPGDISLAVPVTVKLTPVLGSSSYSQSIASGTVSSGTLHVCTTFSSVAVNVYDVNFSIGGNYYTGTADSVLAVYDPSLGFTTGGGHIINPNTGNPANFGFNIKYQKKGSPQGSILYMEHKPNGTVSMVKSNSMQSLSIVQLTGASWGAAIRANHAVFNGAGNYSMQMTVVDDDTAGKNDQFGLKVINPNGTTNATYTFAPQTLLGGTIQVPHK